MITRMLKASCGECAYTVRLTRKWLADAGTPLCPRGHGALECAQWDEIIEAELDTWTASEAASVRTLRDRWVTTRAAHPCAACRESIEHPDKMRHRVFLVDSEMYSEYTCFRCDGAGASGVKQAIARA